MSLAPTAAASPLHNDRVFRRPQSDNAGGVHYAASGLPQERDSRVCNLKNAAHVDSENAVPLLYGSVCRTLEIPTNRTADVFREGRRVKNLPQGPLYRKILTCAFSRGV
jgi:hypothetical protein